jgi:hypothetical protein
MKKSEFHFFWPWQDETRIAWFESRSAAGWHLSGIAWFGLLYHFVKGTQEDFAYHLDFKATPDHDLAAYLAIFSDAGWEYLGSDGFWKYFRSERSVAAHQDPDSAQAARAVRFAQVQHVLSLWGLFFLVLALGFGALTAGLLTFINQFFWLVFVWAPLSAVIAAILFTGVVVAGQHKQQHRREGVNRFTIPLLTLISAGLIFASISVFYFLSFPEISGRYDRKTVVDLAVQDYHAYPLASFDIPAKQNVDIRIIGKGMRSPDLSIRLVDGKGVVSVLCGKGGYWGRNEINNYDTPLEPGAYQVLMDTTNSSGIIVCLVNWKE